MKKSLIALLSVMVVLAFTASAFALHQVKAAEYQPSLVKAAKSSIELGGQIRIRGDFKKNMDFNDDLSDTTQKYDQRVRLSTKANVTANTMGFVELETTGFSKDDEGLVTGANSSGSSYDWGTGTESKRDALYIRQAYISHQFGTVGGIKAGHMLLGLGNRLFFDHTNYGDDALLGWVAVGPGEVSLIDIKIAEENTTLNDDVEAYVAALELPINGINVSADVTYINDHKKGIDSKFLGLGDADYNYDTANLINIGVRADADLKVVKVKGDVEIQTGKIKEIDGGDDVKFKGWASMLGVEANVGPAALRAGGAYGSGQEEDDEDYKQFLTLLTDNQYSTFVYDYSVMGASGGTNQGLANTMYLNLGASVKPIADLKISVDGYYLRAAKEVALNDAADKSKKLGYEIDGKIEYQLASNLAYYIEAGMLFAGDAYDRYDTVKGKDVDADNPYRVRHGLILEF
jgi:hypothetical protein